MSSEVEVISCSKSKGKKCLKWSAFMIDYISAISAFLGLDFEANKPRMNADVRVMMAEL